MAASCRFSIARIDAACNIPECLHERRLVSQHEELQPLLERAEASGVIEASELAEAVELLDLEPGDVEALHKELEERGIEVVDRQKPRSRRRHAPPAPDGARDDDRRAAALPARDRAASAAHGCRRGRALQADRARRHGGEAADDRVEPAARRLDREELPQPGPALPRSDPGGHVRPDPRRREVRVAARAQVLDLRDLVDPPGGRPRDRRQGADDPRAGPRRRADAEDAPRRAATSGRSSPASRPSRRSPTRPASRFSRRSRSARPRVRPRASTSRSASRRTRSSAISSPATSRSPTR